MSEVFKKDRSALLTAVSAAVGVVAYILYCVLANDTAGSSVVAYVFGVVAVVLQVAYIVLRKSINNDVILSILGLCTSVSYAVALITFVQSRVSWIYDILSKQESVPWTNLFPAVIVVYVVALVIQFASQFLAKGTD